MSKLLLILLSNIPLLLSTQLSEEWKQRVLDIHNELRARTARGDLSNQPGAKDMNELVWDDGLANIASNYMDGCPGLVHNGNRKTELYAQQTMGQTRWETGKLWWEKVENHVANGENLAVSSSDYTIDKIVDQIESGWFDEYEYFTYGSGACQSGEMCGHYTQMVWASTRYVGCGYKNGCSGWNAQFVCNYFPAGNWGGDGTPYVEAAVDAHVASQCQSDRTSDSSTGLCGGAICDSFCNGGAYEYNGDVKECDGSCSSSQLSTEDGTGRTIGDSSTTTDDDDNTADSNDIDFTWLGNLVECLEMAGFSSSGEQNVFNGEWLVGGEFNSKDYFEKDGYYWLWNSYNSGGYYTIRDAVSDSGALYGYCDASNYALIEDPSGCTRFYSKFDGWTFESVAASMAVCNAAFTNEENGDGNSGNGMTSVLIVVILGLLLIGAGNIAFCLYMKKKMLVKHNIHTVKDEQENEEIEVQMELNEETGY